MILSRKKHALVEIIVYNAYSCELSRVILRLYLTKRLSFAGEVSGEVEADVVAKELEYTYLQEGLDRELQDLNKRLEQKEVN